MRTVRTILTKPAESAGRFQAASIEGGYSADPIEQFSSATDAHDPIEQFSYDAGTATHAMLIGTDHISKSGRELQTAFWMMMMVSCQTVQMLQVLLEL